MGTATRTNWCPLGISMSHFSLPNWMWAERDVTQLPYMEAMVYKGYGQGVSCSCPYMFGCWTSKPAHIQSCRLHQETSHREGYHTAPCAFYKIFTEGRAAGRTVNKTLVRVKAITSNWFSQKKNKKLFCVCLAYGDGKHTFCVHQSWTKVRVKRAARLYSGWICFRLSTTFYVITLKLKVWSYGIINVILPPQNIWSRVNPNYYVYKKRT